MNLGEQIDKLHEIREVKRAKEAELKEINREYKNIERSILWELSKNGTFSSDGQKARATSSEITTAAVTDWHAAWEWIRDNDAFYLVKKALNGAAAKELAKLQQLPEWCELSTIPRLSVRKKS